MADTWVKAATLADLEREGRLVFRVQGRQIALFRTARGVLACNNRCPHEGYPLREGALDEGCILTCNWHNWKFDLSDGRNLYGGDRLRVYPVEARDGELWVDLADPPFEVQRDAVLSNLREAFDDNDYTRMARELSRLRLVGADPVIALEEAILWSYDRLEFGWTHAYAGAADWLRLYDEHECDPATQLACLLEAVAHIADDVLRESAYPYPQDSTPYEEDSFVEAIEREDEARAVAMVHGALETGLGFSHLERGLSRAALAHYNDFGHSLIYVTKAARLSSRLAARTHLPLLLSLVREIVFATREDLIPEFRGYAQALSQWRGESARADAFDMQSWRRLGIEKALHQTVSVSNAPPDAIYDSLLGANAWNLLSFDVAQQDKIRIPISDNVGWLDFTHGITFASAVRGQCRKFPDLWPCGLLQMACFAGRNASFTDADASLDGWRVEDPERFFSQAMARLFDHGVDEFIVSIHLLKTTLAAREEITAGLSAEVEQVLSAAVNRFLNSRLKRKHVRRSVYQAMSFVARDA